MTDAAFPSGVTAALNHYAVPPLPAHFADRLLARLEAGDLPVSPLTGDVAAKPAVRRNIAPWRRSGRIIGSVAAISLITATAAASGLLGERVYIPVVSDLLVSANIVDEEKPAAAPVAAKARPEKAQTVAESPPPPPTMGKAAVQEMWATLRSDPEFRKLSQAEKANRVKVERRALIEAGRATPADFKAAQIERAAERQQKLANSPVAKAIKQKAKDWRERYEAATPEEQAAMLAEARQKRQERIARRREERAKLAEGEEPILSPIE
jgi:hypothetical protein